jgi:hypothetical protein
MEMAMAYLRVALSAAAAMLIALLLPLFLLMAPMGVAKTVGFGAITATFLGSIVSPWCWLIAVVSFALFFMASRLGSKVLRILLDADTCNFDAGIRHLRPIDLRMDAF